MKITITKNKEQQHYKQTTNVLYNNTTKQNNYIYTIMTIINAVSHNTDQGHLHTQ